MAETPAKPKRALVIDADPAQQQELCSFLAMDGLDADSCGAAKQALELLRTHRYHLLVLDLQVGEADGAILQKTYATCFGAGTHATQVIPKQLPPVVITTARADDPAVQSWIVRKNVLAVLQKPVTRDMLTAVVFKLLSRPNGISTKAFPRLKMPDQ